MIKPQEKIIRLNDCILDFASIFPEYKTLNYQKMEARIKQFYVKFSRRLQHNPKKKELYSATLKDIQSMLRQFREFYDNDPYEEDVATFRKLEIKFAEKLRLQKVQIAIRNKHQKNDIHDLEYKQLLSQIAKDNKGKHGIHFLLTYVDSVFYKRIDVPNSKNELREFLESRLDTNRNKVKRSK